MPASTSALHSALVVRPGALGDCVLTLPVLQALQAAGVRRIVLLGRPEAWSFLKQTGGPVELHIEDAGGPRWLSLFASEVPLGERERHLAAAEFGVVYLASGREEAAAALRRAGVKKILPAMPPRLGDAGAPHATRRLLEPLAGVLGEAAVRHALSASGVTAAYESLLATTPDEARSAWSRLGLKTAPARGVLAVHPGSGGRAKCWPADRFAGWAVQAAKQTGTEVLLLSGPADDSAREEFLTEWARLRPSSILRQAHAFPLREVFALLRCARGYAGNDSGVTHLAARACPVLALFGPSDPEVWSPLGRRVRVVRAPEGRMENLTPELVWTAWSESFPKHSRGTA